MSIKTNYNFKDIEVKNAIIKVERIFGSSREGWNSLITVNTVSSEESLVDESVMLPVYNKIDEFNFQVPFKEDERGYKTIYDALTLKYGGIEI